MAEDKNLLDKLKDKAKATAEGLKKQYGIGETNGNPWPQTLRTPLELYPQGNQRGFLPPISIPINISYNTSSDVELKSGSYIYKDWRGHLLDPSRSNTFQNNTVINPLLGSIEFLGTKEKFNENSLYLEKRSDREILDKPYSTRDTYLLFDDNRTDYFKHGLQIIDNLNNIFETSDQELNSKLRLDNFKSTPFELNDPIIFGFDVIIDVENSPLLNGAIEQFLNEYSNISEVRSRIPIYEDFKQQFTKFFKTKTSVQVNDTLTNITKLRSDSYPESENNKPLFQTGKKAYLGYYLKKIDGLEKLVEYNTSSSKKYLTEYNKDIINLTFSEDVSLSLGTLSHLYKLLYWSKPNGKSIIPENLLRFNCDIVVSEVRNFNRVRKALNTNKIEIIKDNVSRYVYSLYECQFYFDKMTHGSSVDIGTTNLSPTDTYSFGFDYKFSTLNFERFVPKNEFGEYVGYNSGAIWKIGNGNRNGNSLAEDKPKIFSSGNNTFNQNGINKPLILSIPQNRTTSVSDEILENNELENVKRNFRNSVRELRGRLEDRLIQSVAREAQFGVNIATALLNKTLNKIISANNIRSIRPPRNIYTEGRFNPQDFRSLSGAGARIFYDVRGDLFNFIGDSLGGIGTRNRSF
jgi:hypothetical protein